jgi:hypothetical protein
MTRIITLTALVALRLSGAPVHEPIHGRSVRFPCPATVRNIAQQCPACIRASELGGHGADGLQTVAVVLGNVMTCVLAAGELVVEMAVPTMAFPICRDLNGPALLE